ncbi:CLUMA_CG020018, isoform A [Clunio marinus]|uniref:CLUMA_CG020018, isoform A n=1 Tax=Clunio marinus TaxID=568069 RepID=A0A1J1J3P2_9DIPT|nr:CLUMA_CG020018, isoform A [Clunio marinus]
MDVYQPGLDNDEICLASSFHSIKENILKQPAAQKGRKAKANDHIISMVGAELKSEIHVLAPSKQQRETIDLITKRK